MAKKSEKWQVIDGYMQLVALLVSYQLDDSVLSTFLFHHGEGGDDIKVLL